MSSLTWSWEDFWSWFTSSENLLSKIEMLKQIDANFVRGTSFETQIEIFAPAPLEVIEGCKTLLKPGVFDFIIKERHKQMRKLTRRK